MARAVRRRGDAAEQRRFRVLLGGNPVTLKTDRYRDRRALAAAVRRGDVVRCAVERHGAADQAWYVNLGRVDAILP